MKLSEFKFDLPANLLALYPTENRDEARMMVGKPEKQNH
jgi:S-adenosylmethionine:tRNA ribosyltransferase-isomerase